MTRPNDLTVLVCSDYLPPSDGGVENVVDKLSSELAARNVEVHVFSLEQPDNFQVDLDEAVTKHLVQTFDFRKFLGVQSKFSIAAVPKLYRLLNEIEPDVLHLHNRFFYSTAIGHLIARATTFDGKLITTVHLGTIDGVSNVAGVLAKIYENSVGRFAVRNSDHIVAVSEAVATHATSLGADEPDTHVIPNGVDTDKFYPAEEEPDDRTILFVGRLVKNKGPQDLLWALPEVFDRHPNASAAFVGTGPLRKQLETRASELAISDRVEFRGWVDDVASVMRSARIYCRPSYTEGLPLTLLEAMASGIPPIVTPVAGVSEVVEDGKTGILVPTGDTTSLVTALATLLDRPREVTEIGRLAREHVVETYDWESRVERLLDLYCN